MKKNNNITVLINKEKRKNKKDFFFVGHINTKIDDNKMNNIYIYVYMSVDRLQVTTDKKKIVIKHFTNTQYIYYIISLFIYINIDTNIQ
jgi:hypothetical protein